jgi:hypothetical protein
MYAAGLVYAALGCRMLWMKCQYQGSFEIDMNLNNNTDFLVTIKSVASASAEKDMVIADTISTK